MTPESTFVKPEQTEPDVIVKKEPSSLKSESDAVIDRSSPQPVDTPLTPVSQQNDHDQIPTNSIIPPEPPTAQEQAKLRLGAKSQEIRAAKKWLQEFPEWLRPKERNVPEVGDWIDDIHAIFRHGEMPKVFLGFMGPSGCGKSSVINALLEEEGLLPCNCMEACTAVAVEIAWNEVNDEAQAYRAKIQFVTAAEWKAELDVLVIELMSLEPEERKNPNTDEGKIAAAKLKAVYPHFAIEELTEQSATELVNDPAISDWLGRCIEISKPARKGKMFSAEIRKYIDSSPKLDKPGAKPQTSTPYWPLVKLVQIFAKSKVLQTGLILVDLPGSGDANAARVAVADEYMAKASAICIVADIKRALSSAVARNLFGRGATLKRRLLRDGLLDDTHTFFVLTCTDIINNRQVIAAQGLENLPEMSLLLKQQRVKQSRVNSLIEKRQEYEGRLKQSMTATTLLRKKIKAVKPAGVQSSTQVNKRKRTEDEPDSLDSVKHVSLDDLSRELARREIFHKDCKKRIANIEEEGRVASNELALIDQNFAVICIRERNSYVALRMKQDFSLGLRELEKELKDEGDETAGSTFQFTDSSSQNGVQTFCVCSKAYQKLCGRFSLEQMPLGFNEIEDTSMPQLAKHCREFTLAAREKLADIFLEDLTRLRHRMRGWSDNTVPDKVITGKQKQILAACFEFQKTQLERVASESRDAAAKQIHGELVNLNQRARKYAARTAAARAHETFVGWTCNVQNVRTWKALCKKQGKHSGRSGDDRVEYNWNGDLAEGLVKLLDANLVKIAGQALPTLQTAHTAKIREVMHEFAASVQSSSTDVTQTIANSLQNLMSTLEGLQAEVLRDIGNRFTLAISQSRAVDRKVPPIIRDSMKPGYDHAGSITGKGTFEVSKNILEEHIEHTCKAMYEVAAKALLEGLDDAINLLKINLKKDFDEYSKRIEGNFTKMLKRASETPRPETGPAKVALQKEVLVKLSYFDGLLGEFQSETSHPIMIEDLDDLEEVNAGGDGSAEGDSENEFGEDYPGTVDEQDEFAGMMSAHDMDFDCSGLVDPEINADEASDEETCDEEACDEEACNEENEDQT